MSVQLFHRRNCFVVFWVRVLSDIFDIARLSGRWTARFLNWYRCSRPFIQRTTHHPCVLYIVRTRDLTMVQVNGNAHMCKHGLKGQRTDMFHSTSPEVRSERKQMKLVEQFDCGTHDLLFSYIFTKHYRTITWQLFTIMCKLPNRSYSLSHTQNELSMCIRTQQLQ